MVVRKSKWRLKYVGTAGCYSVLVAGCYSVLVAGCYSMLVQLEKGSGLVVGYYIV